MAIYFLTPLRYCQYRSKNQEGEIDECDEFAQSVIRGMPFCDRHAELLRNAMTSQGVMFITESAEPEKGKEGTRELLPAPETEMEVQ